MQSLNTTLFTCQLIEKANVRVIGSFILITSLVCLQEDYIKRQHWLINIHDLVKSLEV